VVGNFRAPPTINRGFISLYSEGKPNTLRVTDCDLKVVKNQPEPTKPKEPPQPRIDVSNGLEGPDSWTAGIPFDYTITVTNTGNEALTDVSIESDNIEDCIINYARLNVGETKTAFCTNSTWTTITTAGTSFSHVVSVTAISDSGQTVTDSDQSGNSRGRLSNDLRPRLVITPESYSVNEGDTVTFLVEAANAGTLSDGNINLITSNVADCNREFSTPIISGTLMRYKCEAQNVSPPFFATFTSPGTIDGNNQTLVSSVELLPIGTSGIHLRPTGDSPGFIPVNSIGENYSVEIENTGSVNLTSLRLSNDTYDCDEEIEELTPRSVERFSCYVPADEATIDEGKVVNSTITVTAEAPDGTQLQDSVEVFAFREDDLRLEITDGRDNNIFIAANPGVQKTLILTLHNSGYLPITVLDSVQINTSSTQTENYSDCEQKLSALSKDPTFRLEPGQSQEVSCEFLASTNATMVARYGSEQLPGYLQNSTQYNVWLASSKTRPADTKTILLKEFTTDPSALPDPTIDPARNREIPINGNFASVNTDGTPTGWLNSCEGTVDITRNNSVELRSDGCLRYMLNPEQLAMLAGNSYKLACRVLRNSQSASISVILDNNTAQVPSTKHSYSFTVTSEVLEDDAPYPVSTGYIELKNRTGLSEDSDCSLTITGQTGSTASIDVRNQLEGFDTYSGYGDFEFELVVTNNGQVPLQDIQLSSDRLDCDTNFASLEVNEIKHAVCSTTEPLKHWNQQLAHTVLATASTADGEIVSDEDYAEHLATETLSQTRINLTQIITPSGSDAVVRVQLANGVGYPIDYIESTQCNNIGCEISPCARTVSPALEHGKTLEYICIVDPALGRTLEVDVDEPGPGGFSREATLLLR